MVMVTTEPKTNDVYLVDTTLRDGEQAAGVAFSMDEKMQIAAKLVNMGITEIEAGTPANGPEEIKTISAIANSGLDCRVTVWCRAKEEDIKTAALCKTPAIHISMPTSDIQLHAMGKDKKWAIKQLMKIVTQAKCNFSFISVGAQDASRAKSAFLIEVASLCDDLGVDRLRLADTVGICDPFQTYLAIMKLRSKAPNLAFGFHGHNDLGMATANAIAAIRAGVKSVDVTVNGLGERTGNTPLEQIVMAGRVCTSMDFGIDTRQLLDVSEMVATASKRTIPYDKPVIGHGAFIHESGIHIRSLLADEGAYEPFSPDVIGDVNRREYVIGKHSGRASVKYVLAQHGLKICDSKINELIDKIKELAIRKKNAVSIDELKELYYAIV